MEQYLYRRILAEYIAEYGNLDEQMDLATVLRDRCYCALCKIRDILAGDTLNDLECSLKIEAIVGVMEELGLDAGARHDY